MDVSVHWEYSCVRRYQQLYLLIEGGSILLFCVADTYVHSVPHYATLWKKIAACTLFIVCFLILAASAIVPTLSLDEYRQCVDE